MVIVLLDHAAVTPVGKPVDVVLMPVAPLVVWVIAVSGVLIHNVGADDAAPAVITGFTVIVPVAFTVPQPPVSGIV